MTNSSGAAFAGSITYTTTVPLSNIPTTPTVTQIANTGNSTTFIGLLSPTTTNGVVYYAYTIFIKDNTTSSYLSSATSITTTPHIISTIGTNMLTTSGSAGIQVVNTITTTAVAGASVPFMQFDTSTQKCTINSDLNWFNSSNSGVGSIFSTPGSTSYLQASLFSLGATIQETRIIIFPLLMSATPTP